MDPRRRRRPRGAEHRHDRVAVDGGVARSPTPGDDPSRFPRHLHLERSDGLRFLTFAGAPDRRLGAHGDGLAPVFGAGEPRPRRRQPPEIGLRVGEHLVAFVAAERLARGDELLGVAQEPQQGRPPSRPIGLEDRELFGGGVTVGLGLDPQVELPRRDLGGRR